MTYGLKVGLALYRGPAFCRLRLPRPWRERLWPLCRRARPSVHQSDRNGIRYVVRTLAGRDDKPPQRPGWVWDEDEIPELMTPLTAPFAPVGTKRSDHDHGAGSP